MGNDKDQELLQIFLEEATDLIASLSSVLREWENDLNNLGKVADLKRDLHTLKGSARMVGQLSVGTLAHEMETLSEAMAKGEVKVERSIFDQIVLGLDQLSLMIEAIQKKETPASPDALIQTFHQLLGKKGPAPVATQPQSGAPETPGTPASDSAAPAAKETSTEGKGAAIAAEVIRIRSTLLETLNRLSTESNMTRVNFEQHILTFGVYLKELREETKRLDSQLSAMSQEIRGYSQAEREEGGGETLLQYTTLDQISKVIRETALDLTNTLKGLQESYTEMETLLLNQARTGTELQHRLSDTRLVPFESVVPRLSRIARQVATELNKPVDFKVLKSEGEMDRTVLEHLVPSLEHILRNALDHGIEPVEVRRQRGKPEMGKIEVSFIRQGSIAAIEIKDDGGGIDSDAVRKKAIKMGLVAKDSNISDEEIVRYILEPGFSTREAVTQVSGRGVGMDVVNTAVTSLGGNLSIQSEPGVGARMIVRFPFTTSLNRILLFEVTADTYGMLLSSLEGVTGATADEVREMLTTPNAIFQSGGKSYYFHYLGALLEHKRQVYLAKRKTFPIILVPSSTYPMALLVDNVLYSRELLVQSLGAQFKLTNDCSGATLLGDGRVVLIFDTDALAEKAKGSASELSIDFSKNHHQAAGRKVVMVVDDSASARAVAKRLLEKKQYQVVVAKDGVEALKLLENIVPDMFLLDIDMPRMDGLELASILKEDNKFKHIPIIIVTALANAQRRQQAKEMKLEGFIEKPYEEMQLLLAIQSLLGNQS